MNYVDHSLTVISTITRCVSISAFAFLDAILIGITSSAIWLKIWLITTGIKKYYLIIKTKKKKHDKIVLLAKSKWNSIEVLISKALIDSNIIHDQFFLINNALKELSVIWKLIWKKKSKISIKNISSNYIQKEKSTIPITNKSSEIYKNNFILLFEG